MFCPCCKKPLNIIGYALTQNRDETVIYEVIAQCPECKRKFSWNEVYELIRLDNFGEVKDD